MQRAKSVMDILTKKYNSIPFEGEWENVFGKPELTGTWFFWGGSTNGKTTFIMQLCKYLTKFERVAYNSLEEGDSATIQSAMIRVNMGEVRTRLILLDKEPIADLKERLRARKSPKIIVIDSAQYSGLTYPQYKELKDEFRSHLFIFVSHARGKNPEGKTAEKMRYDANIKGRIEGYRVFVQSRYKSGGETHMDIWKDGADKYWGVQ